MLAIANENSNKFLRMRMQMFNVQPKTDRKSVSSTARTKLKGLMGKKLK